MTDNKIYDATVIGGGLAGLCFAILLAKKGRSIILFEKEKYPFHKVCGEYISRESWRFLSEDIGVPLAAMNLPLISRMLVTSPNGNSVYSELGTGGFGISRYKLDAMLAGIAMEHGVIVMDGCRADDVSFNDNLFSITVKNETYQSRTCSGAWGKRSNFDVRKIGRAHV